MRVLLVSTYELGHQPLHVASPAAALRAAGHEPRCLDLSVEPLDGAAVEWAEAVALSVPMHTAMRLALGAADVIRRRRPDLPICLFGLYAGVSRDLTVGRLVDRVISGEYEGALVAWVDGLAHCAARPAGPAASVELGRTRFPVPARDLLPPLDRYAQLAVGDERALVGYVEASHGCVHRCRHCPVPTVYDGRLRIVDKDVVVDDVARLVAAGARHVTFGDPDFLNGPHHSLRVVRDVHRRFPELTFDCTVKVEHILRHARLWPEMAASGCLFVVSAFETTSDAILERLDKGHTRADASRAVSLLRRHGIEVRPSFLPFTPWTTMGDLVDIVEFIDDHDLVANVDPVQLSLRLLIPEGSLLLGRGQVEPYLDGYDAERLTYRWRAPDPEIDRLQERLEALVERMVGSGADNVSTLAAIRAAIFEAAGRSDAGDWVATHEMAARPHLTESWFC